MTNDFCTFTLIHYFCLFVGLYIFLVLKPLYCLLFLIWRKPLPFLWIYACHTATVYLPVQKTIRHIVVNGYSETWIQWTEIWRIHSQDSYPINIESILVHLFLEARFASIWFYIFNITGFVTYPLTLLLIFLNSEEWCGFLQYMCNREW